MSKLTRENINLSTRGKAKIALDGYFYNYKETSERRMKYRCNKRNCNSILMVDFYDNILSIGTQAHVADLKKYDDVLFKNRIKENALNTIESARQLIFNKLDKSENMPLSVDDR